MPFDDMLQAHLRRQTPAEPERRSEKPEPAHAGRVVTYDPARKFGWIARGGDDPDLFVHASELRKAGIDNLRRGDRVQFAIKPDRRTGRPAAVNVRLLAA
jgi:cold shock protein